MSFHAYDYVSCKCGEISISGGLDRFECSAKDWKNFLRIDDEGNEIVVKVVDEKDIQPIVEVEPPKLNRSEKIVMLENMVKNIENLPKTAMDLPVNHYDLYSFMLVITEILKSDQS